MRKTKLTSLWLKMGGGRWKECCFSPQSLCLNHEGFSSEKCHQSTLHREK